MSYDGMTLLRAPGEKYKAPTWGRKEPTREDTDGHPSGPAYLLLVESTVSVDSGWSEAEGGGSYSQKIWNVYWSYSREPWEAAVLKIETDNRNPARYSKPTAYLAFRVESAAQIETTIRMVG